MTKFWLNANVPRPVAIGAAASLISYVLWLSGRYDKGVHLWRWESDPLVHLSSAEHSTVLLALGFETCDHAHRPLPASTRTRAGKGKTLAPGTKRMCLQNFKLGKLPRELKEPPGDASAADLPWSYLMAGEEASNVPSDVEAEFLGLQRDGTERYKRSTSSDRDQKTNQATGAEIKEGKLCQEPSVAPPLTQAASPARPVSKLRATAPEFTPGSGLRLDTSSARFG